MALLILIPWVLAIIGLLFIMTKGVSHNEENDYDDFEHDYDEKEIVRVAVYDEKAYWVHDNVFYESDVTREPDFTTARPIDTMSLSPKQLEQLLTILDELEINNERE